MIRRSRHTGAGRFLAALMSCVLALVGFLGTMAHGKTDCHRHHGSAFSASHTHVTPHEHHHDLADANGASTADDDVTTAHASDHGTSHKSSGDDVCCVGSMCHCGAAILAASSVGGYEPREASRLLGPTSDTVPVSLPTTLERPPKSSLAA